MPRIGITGHMNLTPATVELVDQAIRQALTGYPPGELIGVSCLAAGADSIFAQAVLDAAGVLEVILPAADYRQTKVKPEHATRFDELVSRATQVTVMPYPESNRDAYQAANQTLVSSCDRLFAVWDGQPAGGKGGTADVVQHARTLHTPVEIIWPVGAHRH